jgi:hypothetical protein
MPADRILYHSTHQNVRILLDPKLWEKKRWTGEKSLIPFVATTATTASAIIVVA